MSQFTIEIIGYIASILIVASLAMTSVLKLRTLSLIGSITYVIYGLLIWAWPIVIANAIISGLNILNIYRVMTSTKGLGVSPIDPEAPYLADFLAVHQEDINKFQPGVRPEPGDKAWLFIRDGLPVGVLMGKVEGHQLQVKLDYVRPPFRDSKLGAWLFGKGFPELGLRGVDEVLAKPGTNSHRRYLTGLNFIDWGDEMTLSVR